MEAARLGDPTFAADGLLAYAMMSTGAKGVEVGSGFAPRASVAARTMIR